MSRNDRQAQTAQDQTQEQTTRPVFQDVMASMAEVEAVYSQMGKALLATIRADRPTDQVFKSAAFRRRIATLLSVRGGSLKLGLIDGEGNTISEHQISTATAGVDYTALWRAAEAARNVAVKIQKNGVVKYQAGIVVL